MTDDQQKLFILLQKFSDFCNEHNLHYELTGGTLLGAIRHKGFIPWDDDTDIIMPIKDFNILVELSDILPQGTHLAFDCISPKYPKVCTKFYSDDSNFPPINGKSSYYLDIFPLMYSKAPTSNILIAFDIISVCNYILKLRCQWGKQIPYKAKSAQIGYNIINLFPSSIIFIIRKNLLKYISADNTSSWLCSIWGPYRKKEFLPSSWFKETILVTFEGKKFPALKEWDKYLNDHYGAYMNLPPESARRHHN